MARSITRPNITGSLEPLKRMVGGSSYQNVRAEGSDLAEADLPNVSFDAARLKGIDWSRAKLKKLDVMDASFNACQLVAADCVGASMHRITIEDSRLTGIKLYESELRDAVISDSKCDLATFRFTKFVRVCFKECDLREADFQGATFEHVSFERCQLADVEFSGISAKGLDLRSSDIVGIRGIASLKGAVIDSLQLALLAPHLAAEVGLKVQDVMARDDGKT